MRQRDSDELIIIIKISSDRLIDNKRVAPTVVDTLGSTVLEMPRKVWLDVDTGVDDAHAILLALRSPELEVIGISCVAGNADVDTVVASTLKVLDAANARLDLPVYRGCAHPLVEPPHFCPEIHGVDSLGDLEPPLPTPPHRKVAPGHAVTAMLAALRSSADASVTLICLAPLTNLACALRTDAKVMAAKVDKLVWMGGAAAAGGNATSWAEANAFYDPEAAHVVLSAGLPITIYTWDVYLKVELALKDLEAMGLGPETALWNEGTSETKQNGSGNGVGSINSNGGGHLCRSNGRYRDGASRLGARLLLRDMQQWGMAAAQIGDGGAVAALLLPQCVVTRKLAVSVELRGEHTRGMTVCDLRPCVFAPDKPRGVLNADVCVDVNGPALMQLYVDRVLCPPPDCTFHDKDYVSPVKVASGLSAADTDIEMKDIPWVELAAFPGTAGSLGSLEQKTRVAIFIEEFAAAVSSAPLTACFAMGAFGVVLGHAHARRSLSV